MTEADADTTTAESNATDLAILFADIGGSTNLYQRSGDAQAHQLIADSLAAMGKAIEQANGELLRTVGDAVLAKFSTCDAACAAAVSIQQAHRHGPLSVRVGFHWGSAISDQGDVYGNAVNIAARVAGLARTNEIMTTREVVERLTRLPAGPTQLLNELPLKGVDKPLPIYRIPWEVEDTESMTMMVVKQPKRHGSNSTAFQLELKCGTRSVTLSKSGDSCTVGREASNAMQTLITSASRIHAKIECKQGMYVLEDLSTNGTYVVKNNQPFVYVHRDTITLDGDGYITAGYVPDHPATDENAVSFSTRLGTPAAQT